MVDRDDLLFADHTPAPQGSPPAGGVAPGGVLGRGSRVGRPLLGGGAWSTRLFERVGSVWDRTPGETGGPFAFCSRRKSRPRGVRKTDVSLPSVRRLPGSTPGVLDRDTRRLDTKWSDRPRVDGRRSVEDHYVGQRLSSQ